MSAPVDVLADLDELIGQAEEAEDYCSELGPNEPMKLASELKAIRAAVAELMEAAKEALSCDHNELCPMTQRLHAALERCAP